MCEEEELTHFVFVESLEFELHDIEVGHLLRCIQKEQEMLENMVGPKNWISHAI